VLLPSLQDSLTSPVISTKGQSVLMTCVVRNLGNYTLLWKYGTAKALTASNVRISADTRINVLHDEGERIDITLFIKIHKSLGNPRRSFKNFECSVHFLMFGCISILNSLNGYKQSDTPNRK
jgi:hypothetical protein